MNQLIFISRELDDDSPVKKLSSLHSVNIISESLIYIDPIPLTGLPHADWFFFYSRNGVNCFAEQWLEKWKSTPYNQDVKWAALGNGTANTMKGWGLHCDFTGHGESDDIAKQFLDHIKPSESVVFFRALHSRNYLYHIVSEYREASHIAIYDNKLIEKTFPPVDIGVYTSSRNAIAFFKNNPEPRRACIAIGRPTADTLASLNVHTDKIITATEASESGLCQNIIHILESGGEYNIDF